MDKFSYTLPSLSLLYVKLSCSFAIVILLLSASHGQVVAANKFALVIGNSDYDHVSRLRNPANDADLISEKLIEIGFEVIGARNLSYKKAQSLVQKFADTIANVGDDGIVLLYYAGHAIQYKGQNFMVPVDAKLKSDSDTILEGINIANILKILERSGAKTKVIILDASRNNPFGKVSRSVGQGLARMASPSGSMVAYSTAPGSVTLEGAGKNSPYSTALAEFITRPDLTLEAVFKNVRRKVSNDTKQSQTPWEESSLVDDVYLAGKPQ